MNSLSRAETARFFIDQNGYHSLRRHWSELMNSEVKHRLTAAHHMLYLALLGKDWRRAFTPISNRRKLANGGYYGWALFRALRALNSTLYEEELLAPFGGLVTPEMLRVVRGHLQHLDLYRLGPQAFGAGSFPVDAYDHVPAARPAGGASNG